ncbi:MAG: histidine phosphatase family protein [Actinomycetota bacterium]
MDITRIFLVRHGETEWNATRRAQGQADIPLNDAGRSQASAAAAQLDGVELSAVYSSDLSRAVDTARPIAEARGLSVEIDPAFREIDQGEWEGLVTEEIHRRWPDLWGPARHWSQRPGGESPEQVQKRALEGLARVVERHPRGQVAVVSHGGTIRWLAAYALGYDMAGSARIRGLGNGGAVAIDARLDDGALELGNLTRLDGKDADLDDPNA